VAGPSGQTEWIGPPDGSARARLPSHPVSLRLGRLLVVVAVAATSCGVPGADGDRAKVLAATCLSTVMRNRLPEPSAEQIAPERFAAQRQRMLDSGRRFNTVTPYRNVCNEIRAELSDQSESPSVSADTSEPEGGEP
jgi:hypothetical protein